jgi:hypothetical protein
MNRRRRRRRSPVARTTLLVAALALPAGLLPVLAAAQPEPARSPAPTTRPAPQSTGPRTRPATAEATTRPAKSMSADEMLSQMLKPPASADRPLAPVEGPPAADRTTGRGAVAPDAPVMPVRREGTYIIDRVGRLTHNADHTQAEFDFESDGRALRDPPVVLLPNVKLQVMEDAASGADHEQRFKVSGMLTEYRGRNYLLLEKVGVIPEVEAFRDF